MFDGRYSSDAFQRMSRHHNRNTTNHRLAVQSILRQTGVCLSRLVYDMSSVVIPDSEKMYCTLYSREFQNLPIVGRMVHILPPFRAELELKRSFEASGDQNVGYLREKTVCLVLERKSDASRFMLVPRFFISRDISPALCQWK